MNKKYQLAVFIGRLQPLHMGHIHCINTALELADQVLVLVGSYNRPRTPKNPWSFEERERMVYAAFANKMVTVRPLNDYSKNTAWETAVQREVAQMGIPDSGVVLIGHDKDQSSFYLHTFPQWESVDSGLYPFEFDRTIDGTRIRELYFDNEKPYLKGVIPPNVMNVLEQFEKGIEFTALLNEHNARKAYLKSWAGAPFPPTFVTTDAVVVQSGHILLIRRKNAPGAGLWALPGGFLDIKQRIFDSCIRELREETGLKVPEVILRKALQDVHVFDAIDRSSRGRTITHAHHFALDDSKELPRVRGADDAAKAHWFPLKDLSSMARNMFEDHLEIIEHFVGDIS